MEAIVVGVGGVVTAIYSETLPLAVLGSGAIRRASHVEPDTQARWWADMSPIGGPKLGPFERRSQALDAETTWLGQRLATHSFD